MTRACPNCGFSYAWDGTSCGHCRAPDKPQVSRDALIESRFLRRGQEQGWPSGCFFHYRDVPLELHLAMRTIIGDRPLGSPVWAFVDSPSRWTLLTTRLVISWHDDQLHVASIDDLMSITSDSKLPRDSTSEEVDRFKFTLQFLRLVDANGSAVIWAPPGSPTFGLWNFLLPYAKKGTGK